MRFLGLDIGTTSICAAVTDAAGAVLFCKTRTNDSGKTAQDPARIWSICQTLLDEAFAACPGIAGIGVCGQMHGVVYLDAQGTPLSPLFTWQDESGNEMSSPGISYAQALSAHSGYPMASGFGCTTLFVHAQKNEIPEHTACICTIHDYAAMRMCGLTRPVMHTSNAASFGLFDLQRLQFDLAAIRAAGLPEEMLPSVTADFDLLGTYGSTGIPVTVAIGDNQAAFLGAAQNPAQTLLVNVGTGSQFALATGFMPQDLLPAGAELRPLCGSQYLYVGSALCGGRAYALLQHFFAQCAEFLGLEDCSSGAVYAAMDRLANENPQPAEDRLRVDTRFAGTRQDPALRGSIGGIGVNNFTPSQLLWGVVDGMAEELHAFYRAYPSDGQTDITLVGAGNGLRKNAALRQAMERRFGMPLIIPPHGEEAARGAAKTAMQSL